MCMYMCVCVCEKEKDRKSEIVYMCVCVCVCVCERERETLAFSESHAKMLFSEEGVKKIKGLILVVNNFQFSRMNYFSKKWKLHLNWFSSNFGEQLD